jgi:hypothetical protein
MKTKIITSLIFAFIFFSFDAMAWRIIRISMRSHISGDYRHVTESHIDLGIIEIHRLSCRGNGGVVCGWEIPPRLTGYDNAEIDMKAFQTMVDNLFSNASSIQSGTICLADKMCYLFKIREVFEEEENDRYYELELVEIEK